MNQWLSPSQETLRSIIENSYGKLLLCSPFISRPGLNVVADSLPGAVTQIEIWTKLDPHDWLTGASDSEGLSDFIQQVTPQVPNISLRQSASLHAKIVMSDGPQGLAGSANLTAGGFGRNLEVARLTSGGELDELRCFVESMRPKLTPVTLEQFNDFVAQCVAKIDSQEALLALIRDEMPPPDLGPLPLESYGTFLAFLDLQTSPLASDILRIARNLDGNNNTGKVKQAFFGIQRFLQAYPQYQETVADLPADRWFNVSEHHMFEDWCRFLQDYSLEVNSAYGYSIPVLIRYLTPNSGGSLEGGGGGDNELKRVWPFAGRFIAS